MAWQRMRNDVVHEPIRVAGAEAVAKRLNESNITDEIVAPEHSFAAAGFVRDGIVEKIRREMSEQFPSVELPPFENTSDTVAFAYAYLAATVRFQTPFHESTMTFTDGGGQRTEVRAFGIRSETHYDAWKICQQVGVLFARGEGARPSEFALDLCRSSSPHQIVVARVPRGETLAATLQSVRQRIREAPTRTTSFGLSEQLLVPMMSWKIAHEFRELQGPDKVILNERFEGNYFGKVFQGIDLRLDRYGAEVHSGVEIHMTKSAQPEQPQTFFLDGPFLLYLQRRGQQTPFFVMWVENAELLARPG